VPEPADLSISIIIPVFHEAAGINSTVEKLRALPGADSLQIIVVDGIPEGDSLAAIEDPAVKKVTSEPGRAMQMNAGALEAEGDILVFLHADTYLPENALDLMRETCADERYVGGGFRLKIDSARLSLKMIGAVANIRTRIKRVPYGDQAIFLRREYFELLGGYSEIPILEDVELMQHIKRRGDRIRVLPACAVTSARRWEQEGVWRRTWRNWVILVRYGFGTPPEKLARYLEHGKKE
jgi:rSAM/selenodomain-associated transferase 2